MEVNARERVMGDLLERFQHSPRATATSQFLADAVSILPAAIASRLRRAVGWRLWWLETALLLLTWILGLRAIGVLPRIRVIRP